MGCKVITCADDLAVIVNGEFHQTLWDIMQSGLRRIGKWDLGAVLNINPQKTELVHFTCKYKIHKFSVPKLSGTDLRIAESEKYFSMWLLKNQLPPSSMEYRGQYSYASAKHLVTHQKTLWMFS